MKDKIQDKNKDIKSAVDSITIPADFLHSFSLEQPDSKFSKNSIFSNVLTNSTD